MADTGVFCSGSHVLRRAGLKVNSTLSGSETYLNDFMSMAEAYICASTRYDWVSNAGSINTQGKNLLADTVAARAATFMIDQDMSGYTSRQEALVMLNYLWAIVDKNINLLNDAQVRRFIGASG